MNESTFAAGQVVAQTTPAPGGPAGAMASQTGITPAPRFPQRSEDMMNTTDKTSDAARTGVEFDDPYGIIEDELRYQDGFDPDAEIEPDAEDRTDDRDHDPHKNLAPLIQVTGGGEKFA